METSEHTTLDELEEKIVAIEETVLENRTMTAELLRIQRINLWMRIGYWTIIITGFIGASIYVAPYIETAKDLIGLHQDVAE